MNRHFPNGQLPKGGPIVTPWKLGVGLWALTAALMLSACAERPALRVCADPNNLPFSNERGEGFENKLADMIARDAGTRVEYTWWAQRRGFVRNTLNAGSCDIVIGVPTDFEPT